MVIDRLFSFFTLCFILTVLQRVVELKRAQRNRMYMLDHGFKPADTDRSYLIMISVHTLWLLLIGLEFYYFPRTIPQLIVWAALLAFLCAQILRISAIRTLGKQWNTRVMTTDIFSADHKILASGPYRYVRHPNYLAVMLEFAALPIIGGAILSAIIGSIANCIVIRHRVEAEEACLFKRPGYAAAFSNLPRFVPRVRLIKYK